MVHMGEVLYCSAMAMPVTLYSYSHLSRSLHDRTVQCTVYL
jgi:hypothetical protein